MPMTLNPAARSSNQTQDSMSQSGDSSIASQDTTRPTRSPGRPLLLVLEVESSEVRCAASSILLYSPLAHSATLGNPLFLIKARMQAYSPALPVGAQHHYRSSFHALSSVVQNEGKLGLVRGVGSAMLRTAMVRVSYRPGVGLLITAGSRVLQCNCRRTIMPSGS